jgi:predicted small lipoprotein YifL
MRYFKQTAVIFALLLVLCACGQRGPLYIPEKPPADNQTPLTQNPTQPSEPSIRSES